MKAIQFNRFGDAHVLRMRDVADPVLRAADILIRVAGSGVNRADIGFRNGHGDLHCVRRSYRQGHGDRQHYPLEEAPEVHRRMETGASFGKIILRTD